MIPMRGTEENRRRRANCKREILEKARRKRIQTISMDEAWGSGVF